MFWIPENYGVATELKMTEWKSVKTEDKLYTARLPQVYLMHKDCFSIKLGGGGGEDRIGDEKIVMQTG